MQLLIILALLMFGGKSGNLLAEVKPVLESLGGDEMRKALKNAEEISSVISAVQSFASGGVSDDVGTDGFDDGGVESSNKSDFKNSKSSTVAPSSFALAPISNIADKDITYSLSRYISSAN